MRIKQLSTAFLLTLGLAASPILFAEEEAADKSKECVAPTGSPIIPDGIVASKDEMLAAQNAVKYFQSLNLDFLQCLDAKKTALDPEDEANADQLAALKAAEEAAIAREEAIAAEFNAARTVFMEK